MLFRSSRTDDIISSNEKPQWDVPVEDISYWKARAEKAEDDFKQYKAILNAPEGVKLKILRGEILIPNDLAWFYEEIGTVADLRKQVAVLKGLTECDLCTEPATYHLCQVHMDDMRFLDTFSTDEGDYPIGNEMTLWQDENGETYIGGYDKDNGGWFGQEDDSHWYALEQPKTVIWCPLPDLSKMYKMGHSSQIEEE